MNKYKTIRLGDAASFINGYAFKPSDWSEKGKKIIRIQNLTKSSNEANHYNGTLDPKYNVSKGDLLISWSATLGVYEWNEEDAWLNQHIFKVVFDKEEYNKSYFKYQIYSLLSKMQEQVHGATMKHITKKKFDAIPIPLPPLPTQQKIAAILDAADMHRRKTRALIDKYDELAQSLFLEMFGDPVRNVKGWEIKNFGDFVINIKAGASYGGEQGSFLKNDELGVLKVSAVTWGIFNAAEYKIVKKKEVKSSIITPKKDDLLFSRANTKELVGATCIVDADYPNLFLPDKIWKIEINEQYLNKRFVHFLFRNKNFRGVLTRNATGTSGSMLNISMGKLKDLDFFYPPISLQNQFAQHIQTIEAQKAQAQKALEKAEELFNSLLHRAFKGELI